MRETRLYCREHLENGQCFFKKYFFLLIFCCNIKHMIRFEKITCEYTHHQQTITAVDDVRLHVKEGEIYGIIGPSGAGKSTLLRCVNYLEKPTFGNVKVDDTNLAALTQQDLREFRQHIGMIFQHFNLLSSCNVYDNIALPLKIAGKSKDEIKKVTLPLLELTQLTEKQYNYPSQLSGGQKQRVAIARALANNPKILLSDEATSALDPQTTHAILQLLRKINKELGVTILLITHEMEVAKEICDRIAIMEKGKVIEEANTIEFFANPKTDLAKQFIKRHTQEHLPETIRSRLASEGYPLWRLSFLGEAAEEPLIAHLMQNVSLKVNILQANIEPLRDQIMGTMIVEAEGDDQQIKAGYDFMISKGVFLETIGYVRPHE